MATVMRKGQKNMATAKAGIPAEGNGTRLQRRLREWGAACATRAEYTAAVIVLLAMLTVSWFEGQAIDSAQRHGETTDRIHAVLLALTGLVADLVQVQEAGRLHASERSASSLERLEVAKGETQKCISALSGLLSADPQGKQRLSHLAMLVAGSSGPVSTGSAAGTAWLSLSDARRLVDELAQSQTAQLKLSVAAQRRSFEQLRYSTAATGTVATLMTLLLLLSARRDMALRRDAARSLASANDQLEAKVRVRTAELNAANETLRTLTQRMEAACEQERLRIARDIHDNLASTLSALQIELTGSPAGGRRRRASADLVDAALGAVQNVLAELRPCPLDRFGVWEALRWKAQQFAEVTKISCEFIAPEDLQQPSDTVATAMFRVVEEALTNVVRHAGAQRVEVRIERSDDFLEVTVSDDGRGITAEQIIGSQSYGLLGMHERARCVGGVFHVFAIKPRGTAAVLRVPMERLNADA
jgi:signal transduction histidine kinase